MATYSFVIDGVVPSWKNNKRIVWGAKSPRVIKSELALRWLSRAVTQLEGQWVGLAPLRRSQPIRALLRVYFGKAKRRIDLDNAIQGPLDALQRAGVIEDDHSIVHIQAMVERDVDRPRVEIELEVLPCPTNE